MIVGKRENSFDKPHRWGRFWRLPQVFLHARILLLITCISVSAVGCDRPEIRTREYREKEINGRPTLVVSIPDDTDVEFAFKVNGIPFVIGSERLHTILEGDLIIRDELWSGFSIYGELPAIEPYQGERISIFRQPSTQGNQLGISVRRLCRTFISAQTCNNPVEQLELKFGSKSYRKPSADVQVSPVAGLVPAFYQLGPSGDPSQLVPWDDIYDIGDQIGRERDSYIACGRPERFPVPHCAHRFVWRDVLWVKLNYKRSNIDDWQQIYERALWLLDELSRAELGVSGRQRIYFPKDYYHD